MTEQGETRATLLEIRSSAVNAKVDFQNHVRTQMSKVLQTQLAYLAATLLCMCGTEITRCVVQILIPQSFPQISCVVLVQEAFEQEIFVFQCEILNKISTFQCTERDLRTTSIS